MVGLPARRSVHAGSDRAGVIRKPRLRASSLDVATEIYRCIADNRKIVNIVTNHADIPSNISVAETIYHPEFRKEIDYSIDADITQEVSEKFELSIDDSQSIIVDFSVSTRALPARFRPLMGLPLSRQNALLRGRGPRVDST